MNDTNEIHILIATSQPVISSGLKFLLNEEKDLYKVAKVRDGHELLRKIESICPDVLLLDWDLLDRATPMLINAICAYQPDLRIIVFSPKSELRRTVLEAGANAFVDISHPPRELLTAIHRLLNHSELEAEALPLTVATGSE